MTTEHDKPELSPRPEGFDYAKHAEEQFNRLQIIGQMGLNSMEYILNNALFEDDKEVDDSDESLLQ